MTTLAQHRAELLGSLGLFTQTFYNIRTGRDFKISNPTGRESHNIIIFRELTQVLRWETPKLLINIPPRYGKTESLIHFVAWAIAHYPDSNFLYISYAYSLAEKQTKTIKQIISLPQYRKLFGVELSQDTKSKGDFETTAGGSVYAAGMDGPITGRGAGIKYCDRFGGALIVDDIHKPGEVSSDTIREKTNTWFDETAESRVNGVKTPVIFLGHRLHEDDLPAKLIARSDFKPIILPGVDAAGNALDPTMHDIEWHKNEQKNKPYMYAAQYMQNPQPAGGSIFKPDWVFLHDEEPKILATFFTVDTAESDKTYADFTVFSFWGLYRIKNGELDSDLYGLHWIDVFDDKIEPKDIYPKFMEFFYQCNRHTVKPSLIAIEKKSTGSTLLSVVKSMQQGMQIVEVPLTDSMGSMMSKTQRFLEAQPYLAAGQISINRYAKHTQKILNHLEKITANDTHRYDDIADTMTAAIRIALVDGIVPRRTLNTQTNVVVMSEMVQDMNKIKQLRTAAYGRGI